MSAQNKQAMRLDRRTFLQTGSALGAGSLLQPEIGAQEAKTEKSIRFGLNADPHLMGRRTPGNEASFEQFVDEVKRCHPDFAVDLGDFGCQVAEGVTTQAMHDGQLEALEHHVNIFSQIPCRRFHVMGNHDVGWRKGGEEKIAASDLIGQGHGGEDITKDEFLSATGMAGRYYSFDAAGCHFLVLDGNNWRDAAAPPAGHDGVEGAYYIDPTQIAWVKEDLAKYRDRPKIVFCHEELHHTRPEGSSQGGDTPFPSVGKESSYVDNGWQVRELFAADGRVLACFFGHKHRNRWTVYDKTHYITMAATHWQASFATLTITVDRLKINGFGGQRSYDLPLPA
jgi:hypothetical protein